MCFVWISEQTAIISLYNINWLICITETVYVYSAVRAEYFSIIQVTLSLSIQYARKMSYDRQTWYKLPLFSSAFKQMLPWSQYSELLLHAARAAIPSCSCMLLVQPSRVAPACCSCSHPEFNLYKLIPLL